MQTHRRPLVAHFVAMFVLPALFGLGQLLTSVAKPFCKVILSSEFNDAVLLWFLDCYEFHRLKNITFSLLIALTVFTIWIAPQQLSKRLREPHALTLRFPVSAVASWF